MEGPWRWVRCFKPDGLDSYDMSAWADTDGSAYLVRSVENRFLGVSRLTDDFLDTEEEGICTRTLQAEAPAIFKPREGEYYVIASHLTGWSPNPPQLFRGTGKSLCDGTLESLRSPADGPGAMTTFNSQPAFVIPLCSAGGQTVFLYMGDRWNYAGRGSVGDASYVWLPLVPRNGSEGYELLWLPMWSLQDVCDPDTSLL